ncbi:MAG: hypothetical protein J3R72DRAFT_447771 [Linnemannia gamsii]|nr:MAG: hypothetical protein J3R72DRAFT_447771 [Linnemannia gamsii]
MMQSDRDRGTYKLQSFSKSVSTKDRQMAIDGYFEPLNIGHDAEQRIQSKESEFFSDQDFQDDAPMQVDTPRYQAVPAFPSISELNEESCLPLDRDGVDDDLCRGYGGSQTVPIMSSKLKAPARNRSTRLGKKTGPPQDPSKVYSGHIRLQSILFARSIAQIYATPDWPSGLQNSKRALVEVIGTLVAPLQYVGHCWEFAVRDPNSRDLSPRHAITTFFYQEMATPATPLPSATLNSTLLCRLYDFGTSLDREELEKYGVVRLVGISIPCPEDEALSSNSRLKMLCVSARSATNDEIQLTLQGEYRGVCHK